MRNPYRDVVLNVPKFQTRFRDTFFYYWLAKIVPVLAFVAKPIIGILVLGFIAGCIYLLAELPYLIGHYISNLMHWSYDGSFSDSYNCWWIGTIILALVLAAYAIGDRIIKGR